MFSRSEFYKSYLGNFLFSFPNDKFLGDSWTLSESGVYVWWLLVFFVFLSHKWFASHSTRFKVVKRGPGKRGVPTWLKAVFMHKPGSYQRPSVSSRSDTWYPLGTVLFVPAIETTSTRIFIVPCWFWVIGTLTGWLPEKSRHCWISRNPRRKGNFRWAKCHTLEESCYVQSYRRWFKVRSPLDNGDES